MNLLSKIISSPIFYPLFRIGFVERAFFDIMRLFPAKQIKGFISSFFGFDFSKWQGAINFALVRGYGAKFLILRCSYGVTPDERFSEYIISAPLHLPVSVYHYYNPYYSPQQQANRILQTIRPYRSIIKRVYIDLEFVTNYTYYKPEHWKQTIDIVKADGFKVGIYTRATWWDSRVGTYTGEFSQYPCWAAQYNTVLTLIPKGWSRVMIWQDKILTNGQEVGTESYEVDHDIWNGEFAFEDEWNTTPTGGGDPVTGNYTGIIDPAKCSKLNARSTPEVIGSPSDPGNNVIASYNANTAIEGDEIVTTDTTWMHIVKVNGSPFDGYMAERYLLYTETQPPTETLPAYFIAYDESNNPLGRYNKQ